MNFQQLPSDFLASLEKYVLTPDKDQFLNNITNEYDRKLFQILRSPYSRTYKDQLIKAKLPSEITKYLLDKKMNNKILEAENCQQISEIIDNFRNIYQLSHSDPSINFHNVSDKKMSLNDQQQKKLPHRISTQQNLEEFLIAKLKQNLQSRPKNGQQGSIIGNISDFGIATLLASEKSKQLFLSSLTVEEKMLLIQNRQDFLSLLDETKVIDFLANYLKQRVHQNFKYQFDVNVFTKLTTCQMNQLGDKIPEMYNNQTFCRFWFQSNYKCKYPLLNKSNQSLNISEKEEKRNIIKSIIVTIQSKLHGSFLSFSLKTFKLQCLVKLLIVDLAAHDPTPKNLLTFLDIYPERLSIHTKQYSQSLYITSEKNELRASIQRFQNQFEDLSNSTKMSKLILDYLGMIFENQVEQQKMEIQDKQERGIMDNEFLKFIDGDLYYTTKVKSFLKKGKQITSSYDNVLTTDELRILRKQRSLRIKPASNVKYLGIDEDFQLKLELKNIPLVIVKIYQIDLEKQYLEEKSQIVDEINLLSLAPSFKFEHKIQIKSEYQVTQYNLPIDLKKERGLYILQIEGMGQSSRAIIRRGSIIPIKHNSLLGVQIKLYWENAQIIDKPTILWLNGRKNSVKDGKCIIPYGKNQQNFAAVVVCEGFAHLFDLQVPQEQYDLKISYLYNQETFIVGNKAKIILHPRLYLTAQSQSQRQLVSVKMMKNINIQVSMEDNLSIKSSLSFKNVILTEKEDYVLEFPIQTYTKCIRISGTANIKKYNGENQKISFEKSIRIALGDINSRIEGIYLRNQNTNLKIYDKSSQEYVAYILGLNGEPIPNIKVNVFVEYAFSMYTDNFQLETNDKGQINLGKLSIVKKIKIAVKNTANQGIMSKQWNLMENLQNVELKNGTNFSFKQEQDIRIPLPQSYKLFHSIKNKDFILKKISQGLQLDNLSQNIKIVNEKYLEVSKLFEGKYSLRIISLNINYNLNIIKGKSFEKANQVYIESQSKIYELLRNSNEYLRLGEMRIVEKQEENEIEIEILKGDKNIKIQQNVKIHILLSNFIPSGSVQTQLMGLNRKSIDLQIHSFQRKHNSYLSNKKVSQETAYILNRKTQKQFIGNNFAKPHILLNRINLRTTNQISETMNQATNYQRSNQQYVPQSNFLALDIEEQTKYQSGGGFGGGGSSFFRDGSDAHYISSHNNFIAVPGCIITNIKDDHVLKFKTKKCYNYCKIVLLSNCSMLRSQYILPSIEVLTKSITHTGLPKQEESKAISISREIYPLFKDSNSLKINRNSKWSAVSLLNIKNFAESKGVKLDDWIDKWSGLSQEIKCKIYNKKMCHQLNCFIKHHDLPFFNQVVFSFLKNKVNKTLVDLCLLEDKKCLQWTTIGVFQNINIFEQTLLIQYLTSSGKYQLASRLANTVISIEKSKKISFNHYKQQFDTMLNAGVEGNQINPPPPPPPQMYNYQQAQQNQQQQMYQPPQQNQYTYTSSYLPPPPPAACFSSYNILSSGQFGGNAPPPGMMYSPPPPPSGMMPQSRLLPSQSYPKRNSLFFQENQSKSLDGIQVRLEAQRNYAVEFKEIQKTQEYDEVTYQGIKSSSASTKNLISSSKFWSELAAHLINPKNKNKFFLSESILSLSTKLEYQLACCFLPNNLNPDYDMKIVENKFEITANNEFLIFLKQIKQMDYLPKFGIALYHRFYDPEDQYIYNEDGLREEKCIENKQFKVLKPYCVQTIITNTSGNTLELQVLLDIPEGSVPLQTNQYTQITSLTLSSFTTTSFDRKFYFPKQGNYQFYPANVSWGRNVIAKANPMGELIATDRIQIKQIKSFSDILNSGDESDILKYLKDKNIFDPQNFDQNKILRLFRNKQFYKKAMIILKQKMYFSEDIWKYSFLHNDLESMKEHYAFTRIKLPNRKNYNILEYYPYYSMRAHKYLDESKSKIRNTEFKQTYQKLIFDNIIEASEDGGAFKLGLIYYLFLQDRIEEASKILKEIKEPQRKDHQLQFDYFQCFLDMYEGYPSFNTARKILKKYQEYPIVSWKQLFEEISETLKLYDSTPVFEDDKQKAYKTQVYKEAERIRISIPSQSKIEVFIFPVDIELYFSQAPFMKEKKFVSVKPIKKIMFQAGKAREQVIEYQKDFKDVLVEIYETSTRLTPTKIESFFWTDPSFKVKINQTKGNLQVFYKNKQLSGCYCKVYSSGSKGEGFYRDGYTDITGIFKYALADIEGIKKFSILCIGENGGLTNEVSPPKENVYLE